MEILDRDLEHYNFNFWTANGFAKLYDLIRVDGLTAAELRLHKVELRDFVNSLGKVKLI